MLNDKDPISVRVELTPAERELMVKYGHPLSQIESALQAVASSRAIENVELSTFQLDRLIADICYFVEEDDVSRSVRNKAYALCERLEYARQTGDGQRDI
jgi:hypothetical protein